LKRAGTLVVFAKAPRPGLVKTRMSPPLSPEQAAELYTHLLDDVLAATAEFSRSLGLCPIVTIHPSDAQRELAARIPGDFQITAQRGRDLGERMSWAALEAAATGAERVLLRGSDSPVLGTDLVAGMLDALDETDVVVSPDEGGGYSLIGMRRPVQGLFAHAMSTQSVLDDTLANATALGLSTRIIEPSFDLDTAADLVRLERARSNGETVLCPRLLGYLDAHDLWPRPQATA
jgi:rSAM/selenodomain-associated transferase 1